MKKFFYFTSLALVAILALSSCKKEEYSDAQLIDNISSNVNYTFEYKENGKKADEGTVQFTKVDTNMSAVVKFESGINDGIGLWFVENKTITLTWTTEIKIDEKVIPLQMTFSGSISGNGNKFTLKDALDETTTMEFKKK